MLEVEQEELLHDGALGREYGEEWVREEENDKPNSLKEDDVEVEDRALSWTFDFCLFVLLCNVLSCLKLDVEDEDMQSSFMVVI